MAETQAVESLDKSAEQGLEPPEMTTFDIATTDGDIIFDLPEKRLRVSSVILSSASPAFKAMFTSRWEGKTSRSADHPKEIKLPEDSTGTMTKLCLLIHHHRDVPAASVDSNTIKAGAKELFDLVMLADKYLCTSSIQLAGEYVLSDLCSLPISKDTPLESMTNLLGAAFMLQND